MTLQEKFHQACDAGDNDAIRNTLIDLKDNDYITRKVLLHRNENGQSCLHLVCTNPQLTIKKVNQVIDVIFECVECQELLYELVCMKNGVDKTILHLVCENEKNVMILHNLLTLLQQMALVRNNWTELALLTDSDNNTALHLACKQHSSEALGYIFQHVKEDDALIKKLLTARNKRRLTPLHVAAYDYNLDIIKVILDHVRDEVLLEEMLMHTDEHGDTVLHVLACKQEHYLVIDHILEHIKGNDALIKKLLPVKNEEGMTVLHVAAYYAGNLDMTKVILDHVRDDVLLEKMLMHTDTYAHTVLHALTHESEHDQVIDHILEHIKGKAELLKKVMKSKNELEMTMLQMALYDDDLGLTKVILDHMTDDTLKEEMLTQTCNNTSILHTICKKDNVSMLNVILDHVRDDSLLKDMLKATDVLGYTAVHLACMLGQNRGIRCLEVLLQKRRHSNILNSVMLEKDGQGRTLLHLACQEGFSDIIDILVKYMHGDTIQDYILALDNSQKTPFHLACAHGHHSIVEALIRLLKHEFMVQIIYNASKNITSPLSEAVENGHHQTVNVIVSMAVKSKCLRDLLLKCKYSNDQTLLHLACHYKYKHMRSMEIVLSAVHAYTEDPTLFRELFLSPDENGRTFLFYLSDSSEDMIRLLLKWAIEWDNKHSVTDQQQKGQSITDQELKGQSITDQELKGQSITDQEQKGQSITDQEQKGQSITDQELKGQSITDQELKGQSITDQELKGQSITDQEQKGQSITDQEQSICCQLLHRKNCFDGKTVGKTSEKQLDASDASVNADRRHCVTYTAKSRSNYHNQNCNKDQTALQYIQQKQDPTLSTKISTLTAIFDNLDSKLKDKPQKQKPSDFVLFEAKKEDGAVLLRSMRDANCLDLIQHEYTQKYLYACWEAYGRYFFYTNMVLYAMVLFMLTTFVVSHRFDVNGTSNTDLVFTKATWINPVVIVLILFSLLTLVYEILQMIAKKYRLFIVNLTTIVDLIVCVTSLCSAHLQLTYRLQYLASSYRSNRDVSGLG